MKRDIKYIIKRILIGVGIVLVMSFINSCQVKAESIDYTDWLTIEGFHLPGYWSFNTDSIGRNLLFKTSQDPSSPNPDFSNFGYIDVCSTIGFKVSNPNATCNDGCFYNNFNVYNVGQSCVLDQVSSSTTGNRYFIFFSVKTWTEHSIIYDTLNFKNTFYYNGYIQFNNIVFSDEDLYLNYASQNKTNQLLEYMNSQLHQDNLNTQNAINDAKNQAHTDAQNTQSAINGVNDSINDSSIPSDSETKINSITDTIKANQNSSIVQIATFFPQMLQLIINGMNTSCTGGYSLGSLYGTELTIPCINPVDYLGSFLWGVIDSILCLCYLIPLCKFLVNKYNELTSMKNLRWQ